MIEACQTVECDVREHGSPPPTAYSSAAVVDRDVTPVSGWKGKWSDIDDAKLRSDWAFKSIPELGAMFGRTQFGIIARADRLGLIAR